MLKSNHTFTTQSATVESNEAEEDSGSKPEGEEEAEFSAGEDAKPWVELEEQVSWLGILSVLPTCSSCIRGKVEIVSDVVVQTISWKIV